MKVALVTGASRGIGAAVARAFRTAGWTVVGVARGEAAPALAGDEGYRHHRLAVVNNAGVVEPIGPVTVLDAAGWCRALNVNLVAPALITGFVLRAWRSDRLPGWSEARFKR